jgi:hypothetical protein
MKRLRQPSPLKSICHELSTYPDSFEPRTLSYRFVEIRQAETVQMTWISKTSHSRSLLCDLACGVLTFTPSRRIGISSVPSKPHSERVSSHIIQWRVMLLCFFFFHAESEVKVVKPSHRKRCGCPIFPLIRKVSRSWTAIINPVRPLRQQVSGCFVSASSSESEDDRFRQRVSTTCLFGNARLTRLPLESHDPTNYLERKQNLSTGHPVSPEIVSGCVRVLNRLV